MPERFSPVTPPVTSGLLWLASKWWPILLVGERWQGTGCTLDGVRDAAVAAEVAAVTAQLSRLSPLSSSPFATSAPMLILGDL